MRIRLLLATIGVCIVVVGSLRLAGHLPANPVSELSREARSLFSPDFIRSVARNSLLPYGEVTKKRSFDNCSAERFQWRVDDYIVDVVSDASRKYSLDNELVYAVIYAESRFDPRAISHRGAKGLMQLAPATASWLGVKDPYNVHENIHGGTKYLSYLLDRYAGNLELALAAYNAGPGTVDRYGSSVPPFRETRAYIKKVICSYKSLQEEELGA